MKTQALLVSLVLLAVAGSPAHGQTLAEALDAPQLTWTTGGDAPWFGQTTNTHDSVDAAQSGTLTNSHQWSSLETTVTGRVAVAFWWKLDNADTRAYTFYLETNNVYANMWLGVHDWSPDCVVFDSGTNQVRWIYHSSIPEPPTWGGNRAWLDEVVVTNITELAPVFFIQPPPVMVLPEGYPDGRKLTTLVFGDIPMTYQWQRSQTNLNEEWPIYNVNSPALTVYPRAEAAGEYRLVASNAWGMATSAVCTVSVVPSKPFIPPSDPPDTEIALGELWTVLLPVYGAQPRGYQWFKNGEAIPSATDQHYSFWSAALTDSGGYSAVVTNDYGACTSRVAQITVSANPPAISKWYPSPDVVAAQPGQYVSFYAEATGPQPLTYSWRKVGDAAELSSYKSVTFSTVDPTNTGLYYLIVTNHNGAVTSRVSALAVSPVTPLAVALDAPLQIITNDWTYNHWQTDVTATNTHDGWCAARSPEGCGRAPFSTTVIGPTNVSFWWRISAGTLAQLDISVDGSVSNTISGKTPWQQQTLDLPAGEHTLTWTYQSECEGYDQNAAWVDQLSFSESGLVATNLNNAVDAPALVFEINQNSAAPWFYQTTETHDGEDAAQSGAIAPGEISRFSTDLTGPGTLSFWCKVSSHPQDPFDVYLDYVLETTNRLGGEVDWHQRTYQLGAGAHHVEWSFWRREAVGEGASAAWVDQITFTPPPPTLEQALNVTNLTFTTGGDAPWFVQTTNRHDGVMALQSGDIGDNQQSWLRTTVIGPGQLTYWYALSTEGSGDNFYLPWLGYTYGGTPDIWQQQTINITDGIHIIEWLYEKDASGSGGSDAVWMDQVSWTPAHAGEAPVFALHPTSKSVSIDRTLEFSVQAVGELPITCTLLHEGNPVQVQTISSSAPFTLSRGINSTNDAGRYWAVATNAYGGATSDVAQVSVHYDATIYTSPGSQKVLKSRSFALTVVANGDPPLAYQWFKNGAPVAGATQSTLPISSASYSDTADYLATVSNAWHTATSSVARVTVVPCFYSAQNLGVLKSGTVYSSWPSEASDINNVGEVVGWSVTDEIRTGSELHHGFVWVNGAMVDLGDGRTAVNVAQTNRLPGSSYAYSINDNFEIVGSYEYRVNPSLDGYGHAAHWRHTSCGGGPPGNWGSHCPLELVDVHPRDIYMYPLDTAAVAINARRQILLQGGQSYVLYDFTYLLTPNDPYSPITGFTTRQLGVSGGYVTPYAMNNSGLVVGRYREYIGGDMPFLYDGTNKLGSAALTNLYWGVLRSVNDRSVIAGHYSTTSQGFNVKRPFLLFPDGRYEAPTNPAGGLWSFEVRDINNRNQLVGGNFATQGALYEDGQWFTLNDLLVVNQNLVDVTVANAINDRGQIVGVAWFPYTGYRACLLTPTSGGANQAPVAVNDEYRLPRPVPVRISTTLLLANDSDPDHDGLTVVALGEATTTQTQAGGTATLRGDAIFYTPPANPFISDRFNYVVADGRGGQTTAHLTLIVDQQAPQVESVINPPRQLGDGRILLSGSGPEGAVVIIYASDNPNASHWRRDSVLVIPASGTWSTIRPGVVGGQSVFYKVEFFERESSSPL